MEDRHKEYSSFVSKTLDSIGYSMEQVNKRREGWDCLQRLINEKNAGFGTTMIVAGSKAEGVSKFFEGDVDYMCILNEIICKDKIENVEDSMHKTIFKMEYDECPPGYTKLKLVTHGGRLTQNVFPDWIAERAFRHFLERSMVRPQGERYLSSDLFYASMRFMSVEIMQILPSNSIHRFTEVQERAGPSIPMSNGLGSSDTVCAFKCVCPDVFEGCLTRKRNHGWPSKQLLEELKRVETYVVPVGGKGSSTHSLEWRICSTKAEIRLIKSFNKTQTQVYILLKLLAREIFKPVCEALTSYTIKNVMFWMSEFIPEDKFQQNELIERLLDCLVFLRNSVKRKYLPNYLIPKRNLFQERLDIFQRIRLIPLLSEIIEEQGSLLLRCKKLRCVMVKMYKTPKLAIREGILIDHIDRLFLIAQSNPNLGTTDLKGTFQDIMQHFLSGQQNELLCYFLELIPLQEIISGPGRAFEKLRRILS